MVKLPSVKTKKVLRALLKAGFEIDRQKGSHIILINKITRKRTVLPYHPGKTIKKPLLRAIIDDTGLSIKEFIDLL